MLGLFIGISPLWGYHIILVITFCVLLKLNKVIALVAAHISIPPMIPILLYTSYKFGGFLLNSGEEQVLFSSGLTLSDVKDNLVQYVVGSFALGFVTAIVVGLISYILLSLFRKKRVGVEMSG